MTEHNMLEKALKLYNIGKFNYNKDNELARKCFLLSLDTLKQLKTDKDGVDQFSSYHQLIQTTEVECNKLLSSNILDIFQLIDQNNIQSIKDLPYINFQTINKKGNTVLHHSIDIGDIGIIKELLKKGGRIDSINGNGNTLLEYACLKKDPNIIHFLVAHGASMEKHLFFRKGKNKYYLNKTDIDIAILLKLIVCNSVENNQNSINIASIESIKNICKDNTNHNSFAFLKNYFNTNELIGLDKYTVNELIIGLNNMFNNKLSIDTYITIITEELNTYEEHKKINSCSYNKIDIILSNLIPFINYPFNLGCIFLLKNEIKYLIQYILKCNKKEFKNLLLSKLFETYIQTNLFPEDYIGIIVFNILSKIKV